MPNFRNVDRGLPTNKYSKGIPLAIQYLQDGSVPIFWGDNQILLNPGQYTNPSGMTGKSSLSIPEVVRFIYQWGPTIPLKALHAEPCNGVSTNPGTGNNCTEGQPNPGTGSIIYASFWNGATYNQNLGSTSTLLSQVLGQAPSSGYNGGIDNSRATWNNVSADASIVVYGISNYQYALTHQNTPFQYFIYYNGPMCPYVLGTTPPPVGNGSMIEDQITFALPGFGTNLCCVASPNTPPPSPPPLPSSGCGSCTGGQDLTGTIPNGYAQVLADLDALYPTQYLYGQWYKGLFSDIVFPPQTWKDKKGVVHNTVDVIFGPKMLNMLIVQQPVGWTVDPSSPTGEYVFSWGTANSSFTTELNAITSTWPATLAKFSAYQTLVWVDIFSAQQVQQQSPCTDLPAMMMQTATKFQSWCAATPGFKYMGTLTEQKPASYFQQYVDAFYGNPDFPLYRII